MNRLAGAGKRSSRAPRAMSKTEAKNTTASAVESGTPNGRISREPLSKEQMLGLVNMLIRRIGAELEAKEGSRELHALAGDLMKLLALQKELGPERLEEVTVRWIESGQEVRLND